MKQNKKHKNRPQITVTHPTPGKRGKQETRVFETLQEVEQYFGRNQKRLGGINPFARGTVSKMDRTQIQSTVPLLKDK